MEPVRPALAADASRIAELLGQLGYSTAPALVERKLAALGQSSTDAVLVAENENGIVGVASLHVLELFHEEGRLGRITSLVVGGASRGKGIGKLLLEAADEFFLGAGCVRAEVTSGRHRTEAHSLYQAHVYHPDERRFVKRYDSTGHSSGQPVAR